MTTSIPVTSYYHFCIVFVLLLILSFILGNFPKTLFSITVISSYSERDLSFTRLITQSIRFGLNSTVFYMVITYQFFLFRIMVHYTSYIMD